jgi:hypothetical protein
MVKPNISQFINACDYRFSEIEIYENINERINKIKSLYNFIDENVENIYNLYENEKSEIMSMGPLGDIVEERDTLLNRYADLYDYFNTTGTWHLNQSKQRLLDIDHRIKNYNEKIIHIENHQGIINLFITFYKKAKILYEDLEMLEETTFVVLCKEVLKKTQNNIDTYFHNQITDVGAYPKFDIIISLGRGKRAKRYRRRTLGKKRRNRKTRR